MTQAIKDKITPTTLNVRKDEPCYLLVEMILPAANYQGRRRWQILTVIRDDKLTEHWYDMGPASQFRSEPIRILGGYVDEVTGTIWIEHTVAELMEIADWYREQKPLSANIEPRNLWDEYHKKLEQGRGSVFGPLYRRQR